MTTDHGNTGNKNALQGEGSDARINTRFNGKLKRRGQRAAKKAQMSFAKWIEMLFNQELNGKP